MGGASRGWRDVAVGHIADHARALVSLFFSKLTQLSFQSGNSGGETLASSFSSHGVEKKTELGLLDSNKSGTRERRDAKRRSSSKREYSPSCLRLFHSTLSHTTITNPILFLFFPFSHQV